MISRARGGWQVGLEGPGEIFTGEAADFALWLTSGYLPGQLSARLDWPEGLSGPDEVWFDPIENGALAGR